VVHKALQVRREHPEWFGEEAEYQPLMADGSQRDRVIAFRRGEEVLTVAPRWSHDAEAWGDTAMEIPPGRWTNCLTGVEVAAGRMLVGDLLKEFPVAMLTREG
jgi:(1->4)-alpha-D-glucan 1-alpha-D-glucosylmutase